MSDDNLLVCPIIFPHINHLRRPKNTKDVRHYNQPNFVKLEKVYEEEFQKWWTENNMEVKDLLRGKEFSIQISEARKRKVKYAAFKEFQINVTGNPQQILPEDLTKNRFLTLLHRFIHKKYQQETDDSQKATYEVSALVMKVNFTPDCCLTPVRFLLGTGFQYQNDIVIKDKNNHEEKVVFIIGCAVLDWLSRKPDSTINRPNQSTKYNCFKDYALSNDARTGQVLSAGAKRMGDAKLKFLDCPEIDKIWRDALDHVSFNMNRTVFSSKLAKAGEEIMKIYKEQCRKSVQC